MNWGEPRDPDNAGDVEASETFLQFNMGWYAHAIFVDGKYPEVSLSVVLLELLGLFLPGDEETD